MKRREFLWSAGLVSASFALPKAKSLFARAESPDWRSFEVTTRIEVLKPSGTTRVWAPAALLAPTPFQKTLANTFDAGSGTARLIESDTEDSLGIIAAEFPPDAKPVLTITSRIKTRDCAVDFAAHGRERPESRAELGHFLRPTKLLPTDGIVKTTADQITQGAKTDLEKARAKPT